MKFGVKRRYVYQLLDSSKDAPGDVAPGHTHIAIFFFDDEKIVGEGVGGLFVEMGGLEGRVGGSGGDGVMAWEAENRERHLCAEDLYAARWRFGSGMVDEGSQAEAWWEVLYDVKGPKKDYTSCTRYTRA